jgi:hypothetical protein
VRERGREREGERERGRERERESEGQQIKLILWEGDGERDREHCQRRVAARAYETASQCLKVHTYTAIEPVQLLRVLSTTTRKFDRRSGKKFETLIFVLCEEKITGSR